MKFIGIIPARYASTRFPGKPLAILGGKTVIQRVYEQVAACLPEAYVVMRVDYGERYFKLNIIIDFCFNCFVNISEVI